MTDTVQRFSSRVENYTRYRPGYPAETLCLLERECGLTPASVVADVGSGTGLLSEIFLRHGCTVYGVEPNDAMRVEGARRLEAHAAFHSLAGTAEATALPRASVDFVTAGQSFHWFDRPQAHAEFARILKPGGWTVLVWNVHREDTPFMADYEWVRQTYMTDYKKVTHRNLTAEDFAAFYHPGTYTLARFANAQQFDYAGLEGRAMSSSYAPEAGHPAHAPMLADLRRVFDAHQSEGRVTFLYETEVYYGQFNAR